MVIKMGLDKGRLLKIMINLTLPESVYYGKDEVNKKQFMKLYKSLKLKWDEHAILDDKEISGWFNADKTEYIIKLQEINGYKRLSIVGCETIIEFFKGLGATEFELFYDDIKEKPKREVKPKVEVKQEVKSFIGADLIHHYRIEEMLKGMPENWGVKWK